MHEFKFRRDSTTNFRVICPCVSEKLMYNVMNTLAPTFSIESSTLFQVTRKPLKSGQSSNLRQIGPRASELAALDRIEDIPGSVDEFKFRQFTTEFRPLIDVRI